MRYPFTKRHTGFKSVLLIALIAIGHVIDSHPAAQKAMVETPAPLTDLG